MDGMDQKDSIPRVRCARRLRQWHVLGWFCGLFSSRSVPFFVVRPKMLGIVAGMDRKDSHAASSLQGRRHPGHDAEADSHGPDCSADHRDSVVAVRCQVPMSCDSAENYGGSTVAVLQVPRQVPWSRWCRPPSGGAAVAFYRHSAVVAQRQISWSSLKTIEFPQLPYVWWSTSLVCSCSKVHRSLTCPSVCNDRFLT